VITASTKADKQFLYGKSMQFTGNHDTGHLIET